MKKCPKCGYENEDNVIICCSCGNTINGMYARDHHSSDNNSFSVNQSNNYGYQEYSSQRRSKTTTILIIIICIMLILISIGVTLLFVPKKNTSSDNLPIKQSSSRVSVPETEDIKTALKNHMDAAKTSDHPIYRSRYAVFDINSDGADELYISYETDQQVITDLYLFYGNSFHLSRSFSNGAYACLGENLLKEYIYDKGQTTRILCIYDNSILQKDKIYDNGVYSEFKHNDVPISREEYEKLSYDYEDYNWKYVPDNSFDVSTLIDTSSYNSVSQSEDDYLKICYKIRQSSDAALTELDEEGIDIGGDYIISNDDSLNKNVSFDELTLKRFHSKVHDFYSEEYLFEWFIICKDGSVSEVAFYNESNGKVYVVQYVSPFICTSYYSTLQEYFDLSVSQSTPKEPPFAYTELLNWYYDKISIGWKDYYQEEYCYGVASDKDTADAVSYLWYSYTIPTISDSGYQLIDINHDGIDELIVGRISEYDGSASLYDLYTLFNGKPVRLASSGERDWFSVGDGMIYESGSGGAAVHSNTTYHITGGKLKPLEEYLFDGIKDEKNPYFYSNEFISSEDSTRFEFQNWKHITAEEYEQSNHNLTYTLNLQLFSEYNPT